MGRLFTVSLEGMFYTCDFCGTHLALYDDLVSKVGPTYVFNKVVNVIRGELGDRMRMPTGRYTVIIMYCVGCWARIGFYYEAVRENVQEKLALYRWKMSFHGPDGEYSPP